MPLQRLGIVVGGGPAPGINAVIGAAAIEAINRGLEVVGFYDGFKWLSSEEFDASRHTTSLEIATVSRIHFDGGSVLRTSRASLLDKRRGMKERAVAPDPTLVGRVLHNLRSSGVDALLTIGGDDTALSARFVCDSSRGALRLVHVPKTIDNDLPLPHDVPTFGFSTARYLGTQIVMNLMRDSATTGRWYICETMGRSSGWLALSIGLAAGASLTLIPEEFETDTKFRSILDVIEGAILKRRALGRSDGVVVMAEGLAYVLGDKEELQALLGREVPLDAAGHPRLSEVNLVRLVKAGVQERFQRRGDPIDLVDHELGYELRSAAPTPFDMSYCRSLGYFSIQLLLDPSAPNGVMATLVNGNLEPIALHDMIDPVTNRTRTRVVDTTSDMYRVARAYMIRLETSDLENPAMVDKLAAEAKLAPEAFRDKFRRAATRRTEGLPDVTASPRDELVSTARAAAQPKPSAL
jgi:6-phosphofructokinase 1